ncbi:MAG: hypothetical protein ACI8TQ_003567 [Planctomycetota bacterium]|jgi:hypothetical protein
MATPNTSRTLFSPLRITGSILMAVTIGSVGQAQSSGYGVDEDSDDFYKISEPNSTWSIDLGVTAFGEGNLNKNGEDLSLSRTRLSFNYAWPSTKNSKYSIRIMEEDSNYDFDGVQPLGLITPFRSVKQTTFSTSFTKWDKDGSWILNTALSSGRESGVSVSQGIYAELVTGKLWKWNDNVKVGIGLYAYTQLENDATFLPFPIFEWQIADDLKFGFIESSHPGFGLKYNWTDSVDLYVIGSQDVRQYRLLDRTEVSGNTSAAVDDAISLRAGFVYGDDTFKAELFGGLTRRELTVESSGTTHSLGAGEGDDVVDPAASIGASLSWRL